MSQHTYTLKFTIKSQESIKGKYPIQGETLDTDTEEDLTVVIGPDEATKEDIIKAEVEKAIKEAIPTQRGAINVLFDSLTEV